MNNRWRQKNKALRMYWKSVKYSNELLKHNTFMDNLSNAIRAFREAAAKCANTMVEWLNSEGVRNLLDVMERLKEVDE